jgi:RTX calcium-binding nonapeptide repeat (4 copies)
MHRRWSALRGFLVLALASSIPLFGLAAIPSASAQEGPGLDLEIPELDTPRFSIPEGTTPRQTKAAAAVCNVPSGPYPTIQSAINDANCDPIVVAAGTFNEDLTIARTVTINGAGQNVTVIDGTGAGTVVTIADATARTVTITGVKITGGGGSDVGGVGISGASHTVTFDDVAVTGNSVSDSFGGLLAQDGPNLTLMNSSVSGNQAGINFAGMTAIDGTTKLIDSAVDANTTPGTFGALLVLNSASPTVSFQMTNSSASNNVADTGIAGITLSNAVGAIGNSVSSNNRSASGLPVGLLVAGDEAAVDLVNSTVSGNIGPGAVGGILAENDSLLNITNSTVSGNEAGGIIGGVGAGTTAVVNLTNSTVSGNKAGQSGGGLYAQNDATINVLNSTITNNTADSDNTGDGNGGGAFQTDTAAINLKNTILAGNTVGTGSTGPDCFGTITSQGFNILGTNAGCTFGAQGSDKVNTNPMLGPLADNGGPTLTHALLAGSPAIDAAGPGAPATDQRGLPRDAAPDIGAYEVVTCAGVVVNRVGTDGNDILIGTPGPDGILGFAGNDIIKSGNDNDAICAGPGKDRVRAGNSAKGGFDRVLGEGGADRLFGQGGRDRLRGGGGKDRIKAGSGRDRLAGQNGKDELRGQGGADKLNGGPGKDLCNGGAGKDKAAKCETVQLVP